MQRRTFFLTPLVALARDTPQRHIPLEGARNFRDIGGYPTVDGKHIRSGRVFRSDGLATLTEADYQKLAALRIQTVCDLRSAAEREREKTQWKGANPPQIVALDIMAANPARAGEDPTKTFFTRLMSRGGPSAASDLMAESMREMALTAAPLYGQMIRRIVETRQPLLFHCTAGKDRTGLGAALLMKTVGVTPEAIEEDYLLVNQLVPPDQNARALADRLKALGGQEIPVDQLKALMGTKREWLASAFTAIDEKYGSFLRYRREALSVNDADQKKLRRWLVG